MGRATPSREPLHAFLIDGIPIAVGNIDREDPEFLDAIAGWAQNAVYKLVRLIDATHLRGEVRVQSDGMIYLECTEQSRPSIDAALASIDRRPLLPFDP